MSATIRVQNAFHFGVAWLLANKNQNSKTVIERRPKHKRQKKTTSKPIISMAINTKFRRKRKKKINNNRTTILIPIC